MLAVSQSVAGFTKPVEPNTHLDDLNYERFKACILDYDFAPQNNKNIKPKRRRKIIRSSYNFQKDVKVDKQIHFPKSRPISPILKSDGLVKNAFERYNQPIKHAIPSLYDKKYRRHGGFDMVNPSVLNVSHGINQVAHVCL